MKANRIITIIAAVALTISVSAQQSAHDNYVGVSFGGGLNTMLYKPANGQQSVGAGFDAGIFYSRFFNSWVGLGVGAQFSWANAYTKYNWNEVTAGLYHPSNPNIPYTLTTGFNNFKERQNIGVVSIPVEVLFRKAFNDRVALIAGIGLSLDLPIYGKYNAKDGSYSTTGVFPSLGNYTISNMPEHGFSTYTTTQDAKCNNLAKVGGSVIADLGTRIALNDNWGLYIGVNFGYGFTNLLKEEKTAEMLMVNPNNPAIIDYRGTFDSNQTNKANLLRCGIKLAIDFGWPSKDKVDPNAELEALAMAAKADSIAAAQAEAERLAAEQERLAREQAERERMEAERLAKERAAAEAAAREEAFRKSVEELTVHFETERAKLNIPENEKKVVDELCERMKADNSIKIVITGHTDNYGDPKQNLEFYGVKRAEALRDYMVNQGVDAGQIRCNSKGDKEPIAPNDNRLNRNKNRRAEIKFE